MAKVHYNFLRALELEGRHPEDAGIWGVTNGRMHFGEGALPQVDNAEWTAEHAEGEQLPPVPSVRVHDLRARRIAYYKRVRTIDECERVIQARSHGPLLSLYLFSGWANPVGGVIPMPIPEEPPLPQTHAVRIVEFSRPRRQFRFWNSWKNWGEEGRANLPYEYFEKYVFESWMMYSTLRYEKRREIIESGRNEIQWVARDESDRRIYGYEIWDERKEDRWAWAFVIERDDALEVEELYVRPEFRSKGHGRLLAENIKALAVGKNLPVRMWVPFADCKSERPSNYLPLIAITRIVGLHFQRCPVQWAAYLATNQGDGSQSPLEPGMVPPRPRSPSSVVLAAALLLGSASPGTNGIPEKQLTAATDDVLPTINSEDWEAMNRRRAELIGKDIDHGLTVAERAEYEHLQKMSLAAVLKACPHPKPDIEGLSRLREELRFASSRRKE